MVRKLLVCCFVCSMVSAAIGAEPDPKPIDIAPHANEKKIVIKTNLDSLKEKSIGVIEYAATGPFKDAQAPATDKVKKRLATHNRKSASAEGWAVMGELDARLKKLPKDRYSIDTYKHGNGHKLDYVLFFPANYDKGKKYPLILSLHGSGGSKLKDMLSLVGRNAGPAVAVLNQQEKHPCFVMVPRANPKNLWGYGPSHREMRGDKNWRGNWRSNAEEVIGLLEDVTARYSVDTSRRYVMGQSMGGMGALEMAVNHPGIFAATVPVVGIPNPQDVSKLDCPMWLFTGEFESVLVSKVPKVRYHVEFYKAARAADKDVRLTVFSRRGHMCHHLAYYHPEFWQWLFAQKRKR